MKTYPLLKIYLVLASYTIYAHPTAEGMDIEILKKVPIITTNAHHHSVQYWLKKELKSKNIKGLPILHFDSHTDMGFTPSHYLHKNVFLNTRNLLDNLTEAKIKSFQKSLTDISQVIIPAIATGLSNEVHMCMPGWFTRFNIFNKEVLFSAVTMNKAQFINSNTHRIYPVTNIKNTSNSSPFFHNQRDYSKSSSITFYKCFEGPSIKIKSDYKLSLDLDILSTNGIEHDHARPISKFRSIKSEISNKELTAFENRINKIKEIVLKLKAKGLSPKIITIALSTGNEGGNYTPQSLAHKANIKFIKFFKDTFR